MSSQKRSDEAQSIIRADTPYPAMLLIGRLDATAGAVASFDFQNIPATFSKLIIDLYARGDTAATSFWPIIKFNADASGIYYWESYSVQKPATVADYEGIAGTGGFVSSMAAANAPASAFDLAQIVIPAYANTAAHKVYMVTGTLRASNLSTKLYGQQTAGWYASVSAISRITLTPNAGNFARYSTAILYGYK